MITHHFPQLSIAMNLPKHDHQYLDKKMSSEHTALTQKLCSKSVAACRVRLLFFFFQVWFNFDIKFHDGGFPVLQARNSVLLITVTQ